MLAARHNDDDEDHIGILDTIQDKIIFSSDAVSLDIIFYKKYWGCPRGVMVKAMDYGFFVSKFVLQSRYYVHFQANTLGKA